MSKDLERFTPELSGQIAYEHRHRYALCRSIVAGKDVLDVACGEGYGADMLAQLARRVVGVDVDEDTIRHATEKYQGNKRLKFKTATCESLPFKSGSFDVVVSFETIEHITEQEAFVREAARVLKTGGVFVVSTPNRPVYSEETGLKNPFHVKEFDESEFRSLLGGVFEYVHLLGQRFVLPSMIADLEPETHSGNGTVHSLVRRKHGVGDAAGGAAALEHAEYFLAICGDSPLQDPLDTPSLYIDENEDLWREHQRIMRWASALHDEDERLRIQLRESEESRAKIQDARDGHPDQQRTLEEIKLVALATQTLLQEQVVSAIKGVATDAEKRTAEFEQASQQVEALRSSLAELKSVLLQAKEREAAFGEELATARARALEAKQAAEKAELELAAVRERAELGDAQNAKLAEEVAALVEQVESAKREMERRTRELEETRGALENASVHLLLAQAQAQEKAEELAAAQLDCEKLRLEIVELRLEWGDEQRVLRKTIAATKAKLRDVEAQLKQSAADFARAYSDNSAAEEEKEKFARELSEAREELSQKNAAIAQFTAAVTAQAAEVQRFEQQMRVIDIKRAVERQIVRAEHDTRLRLAASPLGLVPYQRRLRSAIAPPSDAPALGRTERREIERSGLFDPVWYLESNPDVAQNGIDPLAHYLRDGFKEDRDPHPYFCSAWYRALYVTEIGVTAPLVHYLRNGKSSRRSPHPLFDVSFYNHTNKDVAAQSFDPLDHYIQFGEREMRDPHPLIWVDRLSRQPGFAEKERPVLAYLSQRELHLSSPHPLFDADLYLHENSDVRRQGVCPLLHYCAIGWREGRRPHRVFAGDWYLANNPDVASALINPLVHFVRFGGFEKRPPHPLFDVDYYLRVNRDARAAVYDALTHFVLVGAKDRRETNEKISLADMRSIVSDGYWGRLDPLSAFMDFGETHVSLPSQLSVRNLEPAPAAAPSPSPSPSVSTWPPKPGFSYWLPQRLRDYIIDTYGENSIDLYVFLMSVVDRYGDRPEDFVRSADFEHLKGRLYQHRTSAPTKRRKIDVSIIIPVYNNLVFTLTSVVSILENASHYNYEIIIGDDCSTDATGEAFSKAGGAIVHVRHRKNLGFLENCNAAAKVAKGKYVVFLNNDTLTLPNWLDELIDVFKRDPHCGLSGSKLLNADGTLQEAGGIFWDDGSAWNFGRNSDPRLPEFNYLKEVDYISGASIALPTETWKELGGFDAIYKPAYCEDSDLAFRVRDAGLKTVYVPHSEVVHHEGKSHGRDTNSGIKAYQLANQKKLLERWSPILKANHFVNAQNVFLARDRSRGRPHILIVDHYIPQWDRDAGSRTMYHFIRMFLEWGFQVTFWPDNLNEDREYCRTLQNQGVEVIYSAAYADRFDTFMSANGKYFDYALLSRPHIAIKYYDDIRAHSQCRVLYYGHDIHYKRMELELQLNQSPDLRLEIDNVRQQEFDNWRKTDVVLYPSAEERDEVKQALRGCAAANVPMLGYLHDELSIARENLARFEKRNFDELLFVGGSHPPNVDALVWFSTEVMPLIRAVRPSAKLNVVGSTSNAEIAGLESDCIILRGRLSDEDLAKLYATVGVAVIPLRFGGGVKGKTIEALFHATPFVATTVGMQGLFPPEPIGYVADEAQQFADAVLLAQTDRRAAKSNVERGVRFIQDHYSIDALRRAFLPFVPHLEALEGSRGDHDATMMGSGPKRRRSGRGGAALSPRVGGRQ